MSNHGTENNSSAYSLPSPAERPLVETDLPIVEGLPAIIDEAKEVTTAAELNGTAKPFDQSQVLGNDRYRLTKTLIESDQVGGQIHYELHLDVLKDIEQIWIEEQVPENFALERSIPKLPKNAPTLWSFKDLKAGDTQTLALFLRPKKRGISKPKYCENGTIPCLDTIPRSTPARLELDRSRPN